jgi:hypothetical protein
MTRMTEKTIATQDRLMVKIKKYDDVYFGCYRAVIVLCIIMEIYLENQEPSRGKIVIIHA